MCLQNHNKSAELKKGACESREYSSAMLTAFRVQINSFWLLSIHPHKQYDLDPSHCLQFDSASSTIPWRVPNYCTFGIRRLPIHLRVMCPSLQTLPTQPVGSLGLQVLNKEERSRSPVEWFIIHHSATEKKCPPPNQGWPEPPLHLTVMCKTIFTFQVISEICTPLPLSCNQTHINYHMVIQWKLW